MNHIRSESGCHTQAGHVPARAGALLFAMFDRGKAVQLLRIVDRELNSPEQTR
ncbi:hypothetical protein [Bradyrhizobium sp. Leo121]|uniref:hypothetical protein n=1 Tax=Bradyrhizobium sp. Leo121 TaxID=1571195 RepID=UPI0013EF31E0|nr:hypothetical protein [Bradyrhizobium sp. Leo121]